MRPFTNIIRRQSTARRGRWRRNAVPFSLGVVLGIVVLLAATYLVGGAEDGHGLEPGELVILSSRDESAGGQRQELIDQWNALHPQNPARIIPLPAQADAAHSEMVARAQSERTDVDIYNLDVTWTAEFADAGYLRPLDESTVDRSEFLPNPIETCVYENKLWALPFNTDAGLLYYRTDLVRQPPGSWPQLARTTQAILADPGHDQRLKAGYAGQLAHFEGLTVNALEAIQAAAPGSEVVRNGKVAVRLDDINAGIDLLRPTRNNIVLAESLKYDESQSTQAFREGKVMFMRNWPVAYRVLNPPTKESAGSAVPFTVSPLPGDSVLGGQNLAIAAHSTKPNAAQALIKFLTDARSQQILFERGGFAATRAVVYQDAEIRSRYPYAETLLTAIQRARPRPVTPCYGRFSETFQDAVDQALRDEKPLPDDFTKTLETALTC